MRLDDLPTPAVVVDADVLVADLREMSARHPGDALRPHVTAQTCTALAAARRAAGHRASTCATPREVVGMAAAGLGDDLRLANEVVDRSRLRAVAEAEDRFGATVTVAVDSDETVDAAAEAGVRRVLVDVGLPRRGCPVDDAGRLAARAVSRGLEGVTEVQAGSSELMDRHDAAQGHSFGQACHVLGTVVSVSRRHAVADVGLEAMGMDHGPPTTTAGAVWFLFDEHLTFAPALPVRVGDRIRVVPAHIDPTMAMHGVAWLAHGDEVVDRWPIDLRGW